MSISMFIFTIYCKKHLHLLQYYKNCQNTWDFINYLTPLCFTWPVWYDTILPSGSSELYSFFISFYNKRFWFSLFWNETFAPKYKASVKVWNQTNLDSEVLTSYITQNKHYLANCFEKTGLVLPGYCKRTPWCYT